MKTNVFNDISLQTTDFSSVDNLPDLAFVNEHFGMVQNVGLYRENFIRAGEIYRFVEGRILWVLEGYADFELSLEQYHIEKGDIVLLAPESIIEMKLASDDYTMMGMMFKESIPVGNNIIVHAAEEDWNETLRLANVLWNAVRRKPFRHEMVDHLVSSIICDIQHINRMEQELHPTKQKSRQAEIFSNFKKLVNENCCRHRNIPFYADRLAITPHYLSTLVTKVSGRSVMYWINRATLVQAKVMLKTGDMLVSEIAFRLNFPSQSAFGFFFKRETGMSPSEYQRKG